MEDGRECSHCREKEGACERRQEHIEPAALGFAVTAGTVVLIDWKDSLAVRALSDVESHWASVLGSVEVATNPRARGGSNTARKSVHLSSSRLGWPRSRANTYGRPQKKHPAARDEQPDAMNGVLCLRGALLT